MSDKPDVFRGRVRTADYERVSHGLALRRCAEAESDPAQWLRTLTAWLAVLPRDARFTHVTGAALRAWDLPRLPEFVPVFAATRDENRPRRLGLQVSRLTHDCGAEFRHGLPVEPAHEILLRASRDLSHLDLVALVEAARRRGDIQDEPMQELLGSRRPGVVAMRKAWEESTGRCESVWEAHLASFFRAIGVATRPQVSLFTDDGGFVGKVDLLIVGTKEAAEYDGGVHRSPLVQRRDLRRERRFADSVYNRRGYTSEDLLDNDLAMLEEIDRLVGRPHVPSRIDSWRALVADSCLSAAGRDRLSNRWLGRPSP